MSKPTSLLNFFSVPNCMCKASFTLSSICNLVFFTHYSLYSVCYRNCFLLTHILLNHHRNGLDPYGRAGGGGGGGGGGAEEEFW